MRMFLFVFPLLLLACGGEDLDDCPADAGPPPVEQTRAETAFLEVPADADPGLEVWLVAGCRPGMEVTGGSCVSTNPDTWLAASEPTREFDPEDRARSGYGCLFGGPWPAVLTTTAVCRGWP